MKELRPNSRGFLHEMLPGSWRLVQREGATVPWIVCPECGVPQALPDHKVQDHGFVSPTVACECGFHDLVRLAGWGAA